MLETKVQTFADEPVTLGSLHFPQLQVVP